MLMRIVRVVTRFAVVSLGVGGFAACTAQVDPPRPADQGSELVGQVEQALQLPNCDYGIGTFSGSKPIPGVGLDSSGNPKSCNVGTFYMSWQCVRMPNGQIVPQNVITSTNFCRVLACEPRGYGCYEAIGCC
jgi:hypothetical protein